MMQNLNGVTMVSVETSCNYTPSFDHDSVSHVVVQKYGVVEVVELIGAGAKYRFDSCEDIEVALITEDLRDKEDGLYIFDFHMHGTGSDVEYLPFHSRLVDYSVVDREIELLRAKWLTVPCRHCGRLSRLHQKLNDTRKDERERMSDEG